MLKITRRSAIAGLAGAVMAPGAGRSVMRELPASARITIRAEDDWYMHSAGVAALGNELVCTYRRSDEHIASEAEVWCCRSVDGGKTWTDHRRITRLGWDPDHASWVAPQLNKRKDGTLLLLIDRGEKLSKFDWPMLSQWQMKDRGMSNHLFISRDRGRTWEGPHKTDDVGGEPSYIVELSNGSLVYTRTDARPTSSKKFPSMPWGPNYYRSTAVFSDDGGKTWNRTVPLSDDPLVGDCEVGLAEYAPGKLIAITRIGDAGSSLGQPSRFVFSEDYGRTWSKPVLSPIYAHRPYVRRLQSGRMLVSYRNAWGTTGSCVFTFDATEKAGYQPNSFIWDDARCRLSDGALMFRTTEGTAGAAEYTLYPIEDDDSSVELEFDLLVSQADANACNVSAGAWIRFLPQRVELASRPEQGFAIDATEWRRYKVVNKDHKLTILVNGETKLQASTDGIFTRHVRFGNRSGISSSTPTPASAKTDRKPLRGARYEKNAGVFGLKSFTARVANRRDHSIDWRWTPGAGYPDQFRRDRVVCLERNASFAAGDSGYSSWDQLPDGRIVVVDYTCGDPARSHPLLRAYRFTPEEVS